MAPISKHLTAAVVFEDISLFEFWEMDVVEGCLDLFVTGTLTGSLFLSLQNVLNTLFQSRSLFGGLDEVPKQIPSLMIGQERQNSIYREGGSSEIHIPVVLCP